MSFDFTAFQAKIAKINAVLPVLGQLVQTAQVIAPNAAGLTKAGLVINTVIAAEPLLVGCEQILGAAVTGIVDAFRSDGTLPAKAASFPAPASAAATENAQ
jgi:hypothetical protein